MKRLTSQYVLRWNGCCTVEMEVCAIIHVLEHKDRTYDPVAIRGDFRGTFQRCSTALQIKSSKVLSDAVLNLCYKVIEYFTTLSSNLFVRETLSG